MKRFCENLEKKKEEVGLPPLKTYELRPVEVEKNGRVRTVYENVEINPSEVLQDVVASDFSLSNLIACGAVDALAEFKPIGMSALDCANARDAFENNIKSNLSEE